MKILVAEDNAVTATLMTGILTRHGYTVVLARNGSEALRLLGSDPDIQGVITDIMMPESSGLDLLRALREHEAWRNLPTIVTTVRDDRETVAQAVSLGCKEYILKPVNPTQLIERVAKVFRQKSVILMSSSEVLDRYSLSSETYREIAEKFAAQVVQAIAVLQSWTTPPPPSAGRTSLLSWKAPPCSVPNVWWRQWRKSPLQSSPRC
jgi:CheY-like chemotaxis protein